jgi:hypothetical protein
MLTAMEKRPTGLVYVGSLPIPMTEMPSIIAAYGGRAVRLGEWHKCRVVIPPRALKRLRLDRGRWERSQSAYVAEAMDRHTGAWERMQEHTLDSLTTVVIQS